MNYVKREIQETRFYSLLFMIMDSHKYIFGFKCEVYYEGGGPYSLSMMNYAKKIFTGCLLIQCAFLLSSVHTPNCWIQNSISELNSA